MECLLPQGQVTNSSRRRLMRWLVGSSIKIVERELILETLAYTHGNRTRAARLLGVSVRTLRNRIAEYSAKRLATKSQPMTPTAIGSSPQCGMDAGTSPRATDKGSAMSIALANMRPAAASNCGS